MSYAARESSTQDGRPVFLYKFVQGSQQWCYTNAPFQVSFAGDTYSPSAVGHSEVKQSNELSKNSITLTFPLNDEFAAQFLGHAPDLVTSVTLLRGHLGDGEGEFIAYWKGRVASSKASGAKVHMECESVFTSLRRSGLRARYQKSCRHALYARGCRLNSEDWAVIALCTGTSGATVTIPGAADLAAGYLIGGMLRSPDGVLRYVVNHVGDQVTLMHPVKSLVEAVAKAGYGRSYGEYYGGVVVKLYPGCDHTTVECSTRFNNLDNYGGFPWIPIKNPFGGSSIV